MGAAVLTPDVMSAGVMYVMALLRTSGRLGLFLIAILMLWAQPGPGTPDRLADLRRRLGSMKPVDLTAKRALQYSRDYLASAEKARQSGRSFASDRMGEAADALLHVAEHQEHLRSGGGPKGPPSAEEIRDHLQRVYFRTQQADYFLHQSNDVRAATFPKWARDFYQLGLRAYDRKDMLAADENAKCAEDVVRALESLAQAATSVNPSPPLP